MHLFCVIYDHIYVYLCHYFCTIHKAGRQKQKKKKKKRKSLIISKSRPVLILKSVPWISAIPWTVSFQQQDAFFVQQIKCKIMRLGRLARLAVVIQNSAISQSVLLSYAQPVQCNLLSPLQVCPYLMQQYFHNARRYHAYIFQLT